MKSKQQPAAELDERTRDLVLQTDVANVLKQVKAGKPLAAAHRRLIESQGGSPKKPAADTKGRQSPPPTDSTISAAELCATTSLTDRRHRQLAAAGYFPAPILGRYQTVPTLLGLIRYQRELIQKKNNQLAKEQVALTKARRETAQEELAVLRGLYVEKAAIGPALRNISLHQRATLQRKLEQELGPNLAGLTTLEILARIRPAVDEICSIFRERTKQWLDAPPEPDPAPEAARKSDA